MMMLVRLLSCRLSIPSRQGWDRCVRRLIFRSCQAFSSLWPSSSVAIQLIRNARPPHYFLLPNSLRHIQYPFFNTGQSSAA
jgi:hypothetical protein